MPSRLRERYQIASLHVYNSVRAMKQNLTSIKAETMRLSEFVKQSLPFRQRTAGYPLLPARPICSTSKYWLQWHGNWSRVEGPSRFVDYQNCRFAQKTFRRYVETCLRYSLVAGIAFGLDRGATWLCLTAFFRISLARIPWHSPFRGATWVWSSCRPRAHAFGERGDREFPTE